MPDSGAGKTRHRGVGRTAGRLLTEVARRSHPVFGAFLDTVRRHEIPIEYAYELIEGMRMDLTKTRFATISPSFDCSVTV